VGLVNSGGYLSTPTGFVLALLGEFAGDMRASRTINQLALSSGKAYANTHATATQLLREEILIKETVGHSHRCRLNLSNDKTLLYLSLLETMKRDELLRTCQKTREIIPVIDKQSAAIGILLVWKRENDLLIITSHTVIVPEELMPAVTLPLAAFMHDLALRATISSQGTLLFGHALYASLLREVRR
jgi:hypothetical protein